MDIIAMVINSPAEYEIGFENYGLFQGRWKFGRWLDTAAYQLNSAIGPEQIFVLKVIPEVDVSIPSVMSRWRLKSVEVGRRFARADMKDETS